jgi:hypothetical protein
MAQPDRASQPSQQSQPAGTISRPAAGAESPLTLSLIERREQVIKWHWLSQKSADSVRDGVGESLEAAKNCGLFLVSIKEEVGHGHWLDWFQNNKIPFSLATANNYMRVAKSQPVGNLTASQSLVQVYRLLGIKKESVSTGVKQNETVVIAPLVSIEVVLGLPWRRWKRDVFDAHKDKADLSRVQRWREYTKPVREVDEWCEKVEQQLMGVQK